MKNWFIRILDSPYKEWIMWSIPIAYTVAVVIIKSVNDIKDKHKKKKILPWIGRIEGIDKDN